MKRVLCAWLGFLVVIAPTAGAYATPDKQTQISPVDCVTVKRLLVDDSVRDPIQINPQGTRVAFLVKSPNLVTNENDVELYVKDLEKSETLPARELLAGNGIAQLHWLDDGVHLVVLTGSHGQKTLQEIDTVRGQTAAILKLGGTSDITEYSISQRGDSLVFATEEAGARSTDIQPTQQEITQGYLIPFQRTQSTPYPQRKLFLLRKVEGAWSSPRPIDIRSPFSGEKLPSLPYVNNLRLSLSPDGRKLLLSYIDISKSLPDRWKAGAYVQLLRDVGFSGIPILVLYDFQQGSTSLALDTPTPWSIPLWSADGRSFLVTAQSPVGSRWEHADVTAHNLQAAHLFSVGTDGGAIDEVLPSDIKARYDQPPFWRSDGALLVRTSASQFTWLRRDNEVWRSLSSFEVPHLYSSAKIASNGVFVVGDYEDVDTPPELFQYDVAQKTMTFPAGFNPQLNGQMLATAETVHWTTSTGYLASGILLKPRNYVQGTKYPLVIQTHAYNGGFLCGSEEAAYPSYIPQPLASSGILYLMRTYPADFKLDDEAQHYPTGMPGIAGYGGLQEPAFETDLWDSAVSTLANQGIVDREHVGIVGFSRKGWYVEWILSHARTHFQAAAVADNVHYSYGEYWLAHSAADLERSDTAYGGPPYGKTLKNWMDYSISFNLDKINTPLLMEVMGYDVPYDNELTLPLNLAKAYEVFTGLSRQKKAVELYYYPTEPHEMEHPQARLANLQRNLDWFRFWLEGLPPRGAIDRDEGTRWIQLRGLAQKDSSQ